MSLLETMCSEWELATDHTCCGMGSGNESFTTTLRATRVSSRAGTCGEELPAALSREWRGRGRREGSFSSAHRAETHCRYATRRTGGVVLLKREV